MRNHRLRAINNVTVPLAVQQQIADDLHAKVLDKCNTVLENDSQFSASYRSLLQQRDRKAITVDSFKSILNWQVGNCLRRAGVPLALARSYMRLAARV